MTRFRRLLGIVLWHLGGEPSARVGEAMASLTLYPTSTRRTFAAPQKRPRVAANDRGLTREDTSDGPKHDR